MLRIDKKPLSSELLRKIDAYFRAANYLSVGQIYLFDNPLLKRRLAREYVKPRLLGHWGTTPGLNRIYAHVNRLIRERDVSAIFITGPGHGGPALVANTYLEGTYSEVYPMISQDEEGMKRLFAQFSFPGGAPGWGWLWACAMLLGAAGFNALRPRHDRSTLHRAWCGFPAPVVVARDSWDRTVRQGLEAHR